MKEYKLHFINVVSSDNSIVKDSVKLEDDDIPIGYYNIGFCENVVVLRPTKDK